MIQKSQSVLQLNVFEKLSGQPMIPMSRKIIATKCCYNLQYTSIIYIVAFSNHVKLYVENVKPTNAAVSRQVAMTRCAMVVIKTNVTVFTYTMTALYFCDECVRISYILNIREIIFYK